MSIIRCPVDFPLSYVNPAWARAEDLVSSIRARIHKFEKMLAAVNRCFFSHRDTARESPWPLVGETRNEHMDPQYSCLGDEFREDPLPYDERRKIRVMSWVQDF